LKPISVHIFYIRIIYNKIKTYWMEGFDLYVEGYIQRMSSLKIEEKNNPHNSINVRRINPREISSTEAEFISGGDVETSLEVIIPAKTHEEN